MTSVIEKIRQERSLALRDARRRYVELIRSLGSGGKQPAGDEIEEVLRAADKTIDEVDVDLATHRQRIADRQLLDQVEPTTKRIEEIDTAIKAADDKLDQAELEHATVVDPLERQRRDLAVRILGGQQQARLRLLATCPDEDLRQRRDEITSQLADLAHEREDAREKRDRFLRLAEERIDDVRSRVSRKSWDGDDPSEDDEVVRLRELVDRKEKTLAEIDKQTAKLREELSKVEKKMLNP